MRNYHLSIVFLGLIFLSLAKIVTAADFTTVVVKPVDNVGSNYFTNEVAGFGPYNPTNKVAGEPGTYTKTFTESSFDIPASDLIVKDVLLDKEKDTIRYKLTSLTGTHKASNLTQNCNFEPCIFDSVKIGSGDPKSSLRYEYNRQFRLNVETSNTLTDELPRVLITHNAIKNNYINADKKSIRIEFEVKNNVFNKDEFLFNIASINEDYKKHLMLQTFQGNGYDYLRLIGFSDKGSHVIATWWLNEEFLNKIKDNEWHKVELDLFKESLSIDGQDVPFSDSEFPDKKFDDIAGEVTGEIIVAEKPNDLRKKLFPTEVGSYSGEIRKFSIYGNNNDDNSISSYPINVNKTDLHISFDVPARTWADEDYFFEISKEGESSDNYLKLYTMLKGGNRNYLQLNKGSNAGYVRQFQNQINNKSVKIELKTELKTKQEGYQKRKEKISSSYLKRYWSKDWKRRDQRRDDMRSCLRGYGQWDYRRSSEKVKTSWYKKDYTKYWVHFWPNSSWISKRNLDRYNTCIGRFGWDKSESRSPKMYWYETAYRTVKVDTGNQRSAYVRINGGSWQELTKESGLKNFMKGGSQIRGLLKLPSKDFVTNFKINGKSYDNTKQRLFSMQEPTLLQGEDVKEVWVNEGDSVTLLTPIKGDKGLTVQSSSFTQPNGSPTGKNLQVTTVDGEEYYSFSHTDSMRHSDAGTARWQFGAKIYEFKSIIGEAFTLDKATIYEGAKGDDYRLKTREQVDDLLLKSITKAEPTVTPIVDTVPEGTSSVNAFVYSPINPDTDTDNHGRDLYTGQLYFTRPGRYRLSWTLDSNQYPVDVSGIQQLVVEVNVEWPDVAHYHHVSETNPVPLNVSEDGQLFVHPIRLSEQYQLEDGKYVAKRGQVDEIKLSNDKEFSFTEWANPNKAAIYRSVLYFTQSQNGEVAKGDLANEEVLIRVVESRHWSNTQGKFPLVDKQEAIIGEEITDSEHTASHTGCIVKSPELVNAMYNPETYNPDTMVGAIFAVNQEAQSATKATDGKGDLVVAWYTSSDLGIEWPSKAVRYIPKWPSDVAKLNRIVVASRLGSDGLQAAGGERQLEFDPAKYAGLTLYNQPDRNKPGFNPNEEHALIAPSYFHSSKTPKRSAAFAFRHDLNVSDNSNAEYTSDPFVLVHYQDVDDGSLKMAVYTIEIEDSTTTDTLKSLRLDVNSDGVIDDKDGDGSFNYTFNYPIYVGDKVVAPYPLNTVIGANSIKEITGSNSGTDTNSYWEDKDGNSWVANKGEFTVSFWYPMLDSFWHPSAKVGEIIPLSHDSDGFVSNDTTDGNYQKFDNTIDVSYQSYWKTGIPELRLGETLTFQGGEEKKDNPNLDGLPPAIAWASAEVVVDSLNKSQSTNKWDDGDGYSVRIRPVVREIKVELTNKDFPEGLEPATKLTTNVGGKWFFNELHAGLKQRVYYDQAAGKLVLRGILNDRFPGDKLLTKYPGGYNYILQPNILTPDDLNDLRGLHNANDELKKAFSQLYALSRDPGITKANLEKVVFNESDKKVVISGRVLKEKLTPIKDTRGGDDVYDAIKNGVITKETEVDDKYYYVPFIDTLVTETTKYEKKSTYPRAVAAQYSELEKRFEKVSVSSVDATSGKIFTDTKKSTKWGKYFEYSEDAQTITFTPERKVASKDRDVRSLISTINYPKDNELLDMVKVASEGTPLRHALLSLYALILNPDFKDFDNLQLSDSGTLQVKEMETDTGKSESDIGIAYSVGLSRFLRDRHNRLLVTADTDLTAEDTETKKLLPNGVYPPGISSSDLELVAESELPYGVTIEDVQTRIALDNGGKLVRLARGKGYIPASNLGVGLGLITNAKLSDPKNDFKGSHIVIAENNDAAIKGAPVQLHIFKVNNRPYRGQIKTVLSDNAFDEKITLRHTGDFGANVEDLIFEWYYRETDGVETPPALYSDPSCNTTVSPSGSAGAGWKAFVDDREKPTGYVNGQGRYELVFGKTTGKDVLVDNSFYVRYRHKNGSQWSGWAGSGGNNPCSTPAPVYKSQLVKGWVKRVTDRVNVYDARVDEFSGDAPATYVSMIEQVGMPYVGNVALNDDKNVIENVGLAELYQTILNRAKNLSIDAAQPSSTDGVVQALQNAASRISKFYTLLGNEAYSDALDPTIGYATNEKTYGELAPTIFSFMNQLKTLNEEELVLLRGKAGSQEGDTGGAPVHNRLLWNFTNNDGEAAYALSYNIKDRNADGFINEEDAKIMYPQGHGDAWGHYLTSLRGYYDLLQHSQFNWVSRAEKYEIDGITLDVDYLDERTFVEAAAYKSKVGSEVVNLTYKDLYTEDPDGQWQGYKDTESYRAWGVDGWVKRSHIGAYYDWVVGNAILTAKDEKNTGIQKIDRETVGELQDISINGNAVLTKLAEVNTGLNPLGLLPEVVPFDIEPGTDKSHFEQVYERAEEALESAKTVFDYANNIQHRIRQVADTQEAFKEQVDQQDREYRNRLIEIFGTPYEGVIGPGKAYPEGYEGPDVNFYQYIDVADLSEKNLPEQDSELIVYLNTLKSKSFKKNGNQTQELFHKYFSGDFPQGFTGDLGVPGTENLTYPLTKGRYGFNAPSHWGQRKHPGSLQSALIDLVKADTDLHLANKAYTGLIDDLKRIQRDVKSRIDLQNSQIEQNKQLVKNSLTTNAIVGGLEATIAAGDLTKEILEGTKDTIVESMPKANGTSNDVTSVARSVTKGGFETLQHFITGGQIVATAGIRVAETEREVADIRAELKGIDAEAKYDIKQHMSELDALFDSEPELRLATFKAREIVRQAANKYRSTLGQGLRLLEERIAFNKKVASKTQGKRYQDMAFRLNRNEAAQKYKASFNMAAKYAYLAAKTYDYETNLSPKHAASAQHILTDIVKASTLGSFEEGAAIGQGGLADILARLKSNFSVLKTQMGFNNPQTELAPFSLRNELFRSAQDLTWEGKLADARVVDIWKVPEFRTHMRPFAAESAGAQPGLVFRFGTTIESGKNFFGKKLSANDHAYDASQFSTRIKSIGIWLEGYDGLGLAETSRAYLVPVGQDIMYVPDSVELDTREWNVKDQKIPVPLPFGKSDVENASWTPIESLDGAEGLVRRHSRLRVYNDNGGVDQSKMQSDSRLYGRSVWNTQWLLIIPGESLLNPAKEGLDQLIHGNLIPGSKTKRDGKGISDIKLIFSTYAYSGN